MGEYLERQPVALDRDDSDYPSRLAGEPAGGVEDVHFHPMERRSGRLSVRWRF